MKKNKIFCFLFFLYLFSFAQEPNAPKKPAECKLSNTPFGKLIRRLETGGDYSAYNEPKTHKAHYRTDLDTKTLEEVRQMQRDGVAFATGAYQIIPETLRNTIALLGLDTSMIYNKELQDYLFDEFLTKGKRTRLQSYLYGNGSIDSAALDAAQEWASLPVNAGVTVSKGYIAKSSCGISYYEGVGSNSSKICYNELVSALEISKKQMQDNNCNPEEELEERKEDNTTSSGQNIEDKKDIFDDYKFDNNIHTGSSDDINKPFSKNYRNLESSNCYCNNEGGVSLINKSIIIPAEKKINEEISQMIVDTRNQIFFTKEYWVKGLGAEASQFAPDKIIHPSFIYKNEKENFELEKQKNRQCVYLEIKLNKLSNEILNLEMELLKMRKGK